MKIPIGIENHPLVIAANENDDLSEIDLKSSIRQAGLDVEVAIYLARQRALRWVLITVRKMSPDQLREFNKKQMYTVHKLSDYELHLERLFFACELDGMLIGWRAKQEKKTT